MFALFPACQALHTAQRRCEELEEALSSRSQVLEMLQQEVSSADQQKQVHVLLFRYSYHRVSFQKFAQNPELSL